MAAGRSTCGLNELWIECRRPTSAAVGGFQQVVYISPLHKRRNL